MADDIWNDPMKNNDLIADVISAKAVLENQTINLREVTGSKKNKEMQIEWLTKCSVDTTDCTSSCDITGTDADPSCEVYDIECLQQTSFKVPMEAYRERTIDMQQSIAFNKLVHMKALDEWLAQYILTGILTCAGTNLFTGGVGDVSGTTTYIAPQYWDDNIWGYLNQVSRLNKFRNPYLITGNNLYQLLFNRPLEAGNADGVGNFRKMNSMRVYQDPENVETIAAGQSLLLHKSAVAFVSKAWYPLNGANAINLAGNYWKWSEPSMNIPGVNYDFTMQETCENGEFYQAVEIKLNGLFACNPYPCDEDNTGTLVFECGTSEQ